MWLLLFLLYDWSAVDLPDYRTETGIATIFGTPGDALAGGNARCLNRPVDPDSDIGIAHRYLECGAVVHLTNHETGKTIFAEVVDAGPYGAVSIDPDTGESIWYVKRFTTAKPPGCKRCKAGKWRGIVDLTPRAAELLEHDGWARVTIVYDARELRWRMRRRDRPAS